MTTEGWIFTVGFRVFDVGLLVLWLVWFFRLRDDDDDADDGDGPGGGPERDPGDPSGGGGLLKPLGRMRQGKARLRDHEPRRHPPRRRGADRLPLPQPARVRQPSSPVPLHRRAQLR